jgi:glycosyltransferase involved in cell wall biosynthesis
MFESWLCGVPFVTSDVGDRRILAGQPPAALLVESGSPLSLAQASLTILKDHRLADQLRQQGYTRVKEYTWNRITDGIATIFTEHA